MRNVFLVAAACIFLYWLLHETERVEAVYATIRNVVSPFVLGASIAFIINVPMRAIEGLLKGIRNEKGRRLLAVLLTFIAVMLVLAFVFWMLIPQLIETIQSLIPMLYDFVLNCERYIKDFLNENPELMNWIAENTDFESLDWASLAQRLSFSQTQQAESTQPSNRVR